MSRAPLDAVIQHIRKMVGAPTTGQWSDRQLLQSFLGQRDEAAFTDLVKRHGPMVFHVCRSVLHHEQDAEDAFQATFLVLARKAGSIRKLDTVGGWLWSVAYRLALKARAAAARRRQHEQQGGDEDVADPLLDMTVRDLRRVLYEELERLPEKYRVPLVHCYLEGQTQEEAARDLGWTRGTVRGRLNRGRELLSTRLARRGLTLSTGLLTTALAGNAASAELPRLLLDTTAKAALAFAAGKAGAGALVSAQVASLAEGAIKAMVAAKMKVALAVLVGITVIGTGAGLVTHRALAQSKDSTAQAQPPPSPATGKKQIKQLALIPDESENEAWPEDKKKITVTGRVLDAAGKPVTDAQVAVVSRPRRRLHSWEWANFKFDVLGSGRTDGEGHFRLSAPGPSWQVLAPVVPPWPRDETALVVGAPGHGVAWRSLEGEMKPAEFVISLAREQVVRGRLIDLQGQPAAGVRLVVARLASKAPAKDGEAIYFRVPPENLPPWPKPITTDDQGRFALHGISAGHVVTLEVRDDRFARQHLDVETGGKVGSEDISFSLTPARLIIGRVVYADTHLPVPNARLSVWALNERPYPLVGAVDGRTDGQGRFRINTFAGTSLGVTAFAPAGEPYLNPQKTLKWPKGAVQQELEMALPRGVLARGTITESGSGKPVAGATVEYWLYRSSNPDVVSGVTVWVTSDSDGSFRIALPPSKGHLLVNGPVPDYIPQAVGANDLDYGKPGGSPNYFHAVLPLELKPEDKTKDVPVTLRRGVTIKGSLVGPDDKPVLRAQIICGSRPPPLEKYPRPLPIWDGRFELRGCDPERAYPALFLTAPYKPGINGIGVGRRFGQMKLHLPAFFGGTDWLGAAVKLSAKQAGGGPIKVRLTPCGSVVLRLVNGQEKHWPLINLSPSLDLVISPGPYLDEAWDKGVMGGEIVALTGTLVDWNPVPGFKTDKEGRVTLSGLIPGATYRINNFDLTPAKDFTVESPKGSKPAEITVPIK